MSDELIIELIKTNKEDKAFRALYKHFPMIRKMILSNGGKLEDAEDVFQESLIILYKKVRYTEFKLTSKLSTYLYSVCRFLWKDILVKNGRRDFSEIIDLNESSEESIWTELTEPESDLKISEKIINELGNRCKELLILFYIEAMKLKDIASRMGYSSESTAKNQKYKCLESAKKRLKELKHLG
ncbi:ECF subfamily RNA polymerase sigma-24 subunit [Sporocytophaga myxococcoides]|uniref:ECF subfamily RNA polymerase sigma-24 subunit n=1 Tax=Sporocytophaga myxococcoides TaxID=153721 RepID=A0A098LA48_9BACT|nr:sigma-70 family RNA polymerase sigma factor [Sporocytophaga myxococcoides]GAL83213.1 ECF subfamily RNA polymerase sigma-24 subunit [Sporocytophaga myxococcoides]